MSQTPEDLPQPIYEDPSLAPPPPPPPGGQYATPNYGAPAAPVPPTGPSGPGAAATPPGSQYPVPGYVPPPPPGGVHGYVPPPAPGGAASGAPKNKLPLIIAAVVGVIAVVAVLIAVMAGGKDTPTPGPNPPKTTGKDGPSPTDAPSDPKIAGAIKVLFPSANSEESSCMSAGFADKTDLADKIADQGGTSGDSDEAGVIADIVTGCVTTDRMAAGVMPNIQQEYQQGTGFALTQAESECAESSLASLSTDDFNAALRAYYENPPTPFTTTFSDDLSGCAG